MPEAERGRRLLGAAEWTARHRLVGPLGWGLAAFVLTPFTLGLGGSLPGYIVGRAVWVGRRCSWPSAHSSRLWGSRSR